MANPPHQLDLVIDFVNTLDVEEKTDALSTPQGLARWLAERRLMKPTGELPSDSELEQATGLREALRALMRRNNEGTSDGHAGRELEQVARRGDLAVHFASDGTTSLKPGAEGLAGALAALLIPVAQAVNDGSWQRVKTCRSADCDWAFYDRSRNRSGVWCDMAVCGNRTKVRAYRERAPREGR